MGNSPLHADNVALVHNPFNGLVSPQYHVVFDDEFSTLPSLRSGSTPANWDKLCATNSHHVSHQDVTIDLSNTFPSVSTCSNAAGEITLERGGQWR